MSDYFTIPTTVSGSNTSNNTADLYTTVFTPYTTISSSTTWTTYAAPREAHIEVKWGNKVFLNPDETMRTLIEALRLL